MSKGDLTVRVTPLAQRLADEMGYEMVEVSLDKEPQGRYLRVYLDKPEGLSLDDCEKFHRAFIPFVEDYDYDFLEISSPGIDRPLKTQRDFDRHLGDEVELRFYKPVDGQKALTGTLAAYANGDVTLVTGGAERTFEKKLIALVKPVVEMEGVETVDLSENEPSE